MKKNKQKRTKSKGGSKGGGAAAGGGGKKKKKSIFILFGKDGSASNVFRYCAVIGVIMIGINLHIEKKLWSNQPVTAGSKGRYSLQNPDPNYDPSKFDKLTNTYRRSIYSDDLLQYNLGNTTTSKPFVKTGCS